jgi:phosphatidylglycerol:prolipoprotein diacylglycerol transferase
MFNFLHTFNPQAILLQVGPLAVHWYAFLMIVGGLLGFALVLQLVKRYKMEKNIFSDLLFYWVVGAIIGARIYYVIYAWELYRDNWVDVFKIWEGGLAVHGIMIGGFLTTWIYCKIKKQNFWQMSDLLVTGFVAAQVIGRVGNYFNQEIFGKPTDLPWGIPIEAGNRPEQFMDSTYFHPTFLYESMGSLFILGILLLLHKFRLKNEKRVAGNVFLIYIALYSVQRFLLEFLRIDFSPLVFGVRWAQLFSVILFIGALSVLAVRNAWGGRFCELLREKVYKVIKL